MASLLRTITRLAATPQGRAAIAKAKAAANDPRNRERLDEIVVRAKEKGRDLQERRTRPAAPGDGPAPAPQPPRTSRPDELPPR